MSEYRPEVNAIRSSLELIHEDLQRVAVSLEQLVVVLHDDERSPQTEKQA